MALGALPAAAQNVALDLGDLPPGTSVTIEFEAVIGSPIGAGVETIPNAATVSGGNFAPVDSTATATGVAAAPLLTLTMSDGGATASPGSTVVYTFVYANIGNQDASGVVLTTAVPAHAAFNAAAGSAGWVCLPDGSAGSACSLAIGPLAGGGAGGGATFAVDVASPVPAGVEQISAAALIADDGAGSAGVPVTAAASDTTPVTAAPDLAVVKSDGGASVTPGGTVTYTLAYSNIGSQGATGVVLTETVPAHATFAAGASTAGWSCADGAPAGTVCTFTVAGEVAGGGANGSVLFAAATAAPAPAGVGELSNTASIEDDGGNGADPDPANNSSTETTPVDAAPDLTLVKGDGGASVAPGETVVYTLTYGNVGTQDATGVALVETVPEGTTFDGSASAPGWACVPDGGAGATCTLTVGPLAAGAPATGVAFAVAVDAPAGAGLDAIANTASIADDGGNGADPNPADNTAGDTTPVDAAPDLAVTKDSDSLALPGATLVYNLGWSNHGTQGATGVVLTEEVPLGTTFDAAGSDPAWSCSGAGAGSTCTVAIASLDVGDGGSAVFAVVVDDPLSDTVTSIVNAASIADDGANGADPVADDNQASLTLAVPVDADLRVAKSVDQARPLRYGTVGFALEVTNDGPRTTSGVAVTDLLPSGLSLLTATPGGATTFDPVSGIWAIGDLGVGESATLTLEAQVVPGPGDPAGTGAALGVFASGSGLEAPVGLALGSDDLLYATASTGAQGRVLRFDGLTGAFAGVVSEDIRLVRPRGVAFSPGGDLFVAEDDLDAVLLVDPGTGGVALFASGHGLVDPVGVTFGPGDDLFVASAGSDQVLRFDGADGSFVGVFAAGAGLDQPDGLAFGPDGHLYVSSRATDQVLRFDGASGAFVDVFAAGGGLDQPSDLRFGPGGDLFVASAGTDQVLRFAGVSGTFREAYAAGGGLDGPEGLVLSRGGRLLVASRLTDEVLAFDGFITNVARITASARVDLHPEDDVAAASIDWIPLDFGDAADPPLPTLLASDGARHGVPRGAVLFLGAGVDTELDGQPSAAADGDDLAGADDEDGVTFTSELVRGQTATATVTASAPGLLSAWVDYNGDGAWTADERIFADVALAAGGTSLSFPVPAGANLGPAVSRFRLSSAAIAAPTGVAPDGEVEDHLTPPILPRPALALVKTDGGAVVPTAGLVAYALTASNAAGSGTATGVVLGETVPAHSTFDAAASSPGWVCTPTGGAGSACTLALADLGGGSQVGAVFAVTADATLPAGVDELANTASLSAVNATPVSAFDTTPVEAAPDLVVSKDDGGAVPAPGAVLVYAITVSNDGSQGATGVEIGETVPVGTSFAAAASTPGWSCADGAPAGAVCVLTVGGLAAGGFAALDFAVTLDDPPTVLELVNTVSAADDGANGPDLTPSDNSFTLTTSLDQVPPTVVSLAAGGAPVDLCTTVQGFASTLRVGFSEPMYDPAGDADPDDVTNPGNWLVLGSGADEDLSTDACGTVFGDDQPVTLTTVGWDEAGVAATLHTAGSLPAGLYRLAACGSTTLVDRGGRNPLDGDGDGIGGDDFVRTFRLDPFNAFANGHLDCDLEGWELTSATPGEISWSPVDSAGSSLSGSFELRQLNANTSYRVAQCVPVSGGFDLPVAASMELDLASGFASVTLGCRYYAAAACAGAELGVDEATFLQADTAGAWFPFADTFAVPAEAASARCSFRLSLPGGQDFTAHLDRLFAGRALEIFADGFESGDSSAWSSTVGGSR